MAAEDRRYYEHGAIDYWGILRALREDLGRKNHVQGGSTIEQQLAKHLIGDFSRTLDRKFLEAFVAVRLEQHYSKDEILNYYLNRIYFGKGYFGVERGRPRLLRQGRQPADRCRSARMLAGIIRAPTSSSPRTDIGKAKFRRDLTLRQMLDNGVHHPGGIHRAQSRRRSASCRPSPRACRPSSWPQAVKEMEQILSIEGTEEMPQGLTVRTNIDLRLQRAIEEQMEQHLTAIENAGARERARRRAAGESRHGAARSRCCRARPSSPISPPAACWRGWAGATSTRASSTTSPWRGAKTARCSSPSSTASASTGSTSTPPR